MLALEVYLEDSIESWNNLLLDCLRKATVFRDITLHLLFIMFRSADFLFEKNLPRAIR